MVTFTPQDWNLNRSVWFRRPSDEFGGFSNMSVSFPLNLLGMHLRSSEHIYQAMRFTHEAEIQREVLRAKSPMDSKRAAREWDAWTRSDWLDIRVEVMRWTLRIKLAQHISRFGAMLKSTESKPIVEWSRHDSFWGAGPVDEETVRGANVLGQLLKELREVFTCNEDEARTVPAPSFSQPLVLGIPMGRLLPPNGKPLIHREDLSRMMLPTGTDPESILQACYQRQLAGEFATHDEGMLVANALCNTQMQAFGSDLSP